MHLFFSATISYMENLDINSEQTNWTQTHCWVRMSYSKGFSRHLTVIAKGNVSSHRVEQSTTVCRLWGTGLAMWCQEFRFKRLHGGLSASSWPHRRKQIAKLHKFFVFLSFIVTISYSHVCEYIKGQNNHHLTEISHWENEHLNLWKNSTRLPPNHWILQMHDYIYTCSYPTRQYSLRRTLKVLKIGKNYELGKFISS